MKKHFYHEIIQLDDVLIELDHLNMSEKEKVHLSLLIDSTVHHVVIDVVLGELHEEDKKTFLHHLSQDNHPEIWVLLRASIVEVENKMIHAAGKIKKELIRDIHSTLDEKQ